MKAQWGPVAVIPFSGARLEWHYHQKIFPLNFHLNQKDAAVESEGWQNIFKTEQDIDTFVSAGLQRAF